MRIGLVSHEYPPFVGGGIGSYVAAAARELARAGHCVHVFANGSLSARADEAAVPGLTVHRLPLFTDAYQRPPGQPDFLGLDPAPFSYVSREASAHAENLAAWTIAEAVRRVHRESGLDVVEVPDCMAEAFYLVRRRLAGEALPAVVVHLHGNTLESYGSADDPITLGHICVRARLRREDLTIRHADAILCPSHGGLSRYAAAYGDVLPPVRDVIPYYFERAQAAAAPGEIGPWPFAVLVGRVEPRKGTDLAVEAFARVAESQPELRLVLCGGGDSWLRGESVESMLRARLPAHLLERVVRLGRQPRAVVLAVLARATLVLHPARWDNWPNAVLEAMSVGACCIVSDAGGQAEMIESGKSGLIVPPGDVDALDAAMQAMLADPATRSRFGAAARQRMAALSVADTITAQKIALYTRAMQAGAMRSSAATPGLPRIVLLVVDAAGCSEPQRQATLAALADAATERWQRRWLTDDGVAPGGWSALPATGHDVPWNDVPDDAALVWCRGGARPDATAIAELLRVLTAAPDAAATFAWLAPDRTSGFFPHRCDLGWRDVLFEGGTVPPLFAVRIADLRRVRRRTGLTSPTARLAALLAIVTARGARLALHIARLAGHQLGELPTLDLDSGQRALGFLDLHGVVPRLLVRVGSDPDAAPHDVPVNRSEPAPTAAGSMPPGRSRAPSPAHEPVDPAGAAAEPWPTSQPLRICLLGHEYPPYPGGGIATYGHNAARAMADAGHEVHVVTNSAAFGSIDRDVRERVHRQGKLTVHRYDLLDEQYQPPPDASFYGVPPGNVRHPRSRWARDVATLTALRLAEAVAELHAQHRFDVVEVPDMFAEGFFLARRRIADGSASLPPICVLGHTSSRETYRAAHDAWQLGGEAQRHRMRLEDACLTEADALVTPSQSLMDRYEAWFGAALPRVRAVIPNFFGVPASGTTGALPTELQGTGPLLLVIGRVEPRKGCDVALAAFAQLCQQFPDLRLAFVGGADHWWPGESFRALCDAWLPPADRQRVLLPGLLPYEQVFAAARSAAVVLHPSRWDNWPNAVLEAMSVGACCVVSDHGGQAEMVEHGRSGMVFPTEDATALAGILRELLRDPARRAALGAAAVARVASLCDPRKVLSAKLAVYRAAAAARQQVDEVAPPSVVVVDAGGADAAAVATSVAAIDDSCSDSVTKYLLTDAAMPLPPQWRPWIRLGSTPWSDAPAHAVIVWLRAGARPDRAGFAALLRVARDGGGSGGGSLWLEPEHELRCHPADLSLHDICLVGAGLPAVVATAARHLARCRSLLGAHTPVARLATIAAMMAIASGRAVRHTGDTGGRDHGAALVLGSEDLTVVLGRLTVERLIDGSTVLFGA